MKPTNEYNYDLNQTKPPSSFETFGMSTKSYLDVKGIMETRILTNWKHPTFKKYNRLTEPNEYIDI